MPLPEIDTSVGHSFGLELDGVVVTAVRSVSGLSMERDVVEVKQNGPDGSLVVKRLPGRWKAGEVTITRGLTEDTTFATWVEESRSGTTDASRAVVTIVVHDSSGTAVRRFTLTDAWPKSLEFGSLEAGGTDVLTETLVLVHDRLEVG